MPSWGERRAARRSFENFLAREAADERRADAMRRAVYTRSPEQIRQAEQRMIEHTTERIGVVAQRLSGAEDIGWARAEIKASVPTVEVSLGGGYGFDDKLLFGSRYAEVVDSLRRDPRFLGRDRSAPKVDEQREVLYDLVRQCAHQMETRATDTPLHRRHLDQLRPQDYKPTGYGPSGLRAARRLEVGPEQALFHSAVTRVWTQDNFAQVVRNLADEDTVGPKTADRILSQPARHQVHDPESTAVRGFLADMGSHRNSSADPRRVLNDVHNAPPTQKAWQIAGMLLNQSPLRNLPEPEYLANREKLEACIEVHVSILRDAPNRGAQEVRQEASGLVLAELTALERAAAAPEQPALAEQKIFDPRSGVAPMHQASGSAASGESARHTDGKSGSRAVEL